MKGVHSLWGDDGHRTFWNDGLLGVVWQNTAPGSPTEVRVVCLVEDEDTETTNRG